MERLVPGDPQADAPARSSLTQFAGESGKLPSWPASGRSPAAAACRDVPARVGQGVERRLVQNGSRRRSPGPSVGFAARATTPRRRAQQRRQPGRGQGFGQPSRMAATNPIDWRSRPRRAPRLELRKTLDGGRQAAGGSVGVDHQQTGASRSEAISAVLPSSASGEAPSNSPITPSITARSASAAARAKSRRT